jgi:hypothetical protein
MQESGVPRACRKGKLGHSSTPQEQIEQIVKHISSFERLPPPKGVVASSGIEYLDSNVSVRKMFEMYKEQYGDKAAKEYLYRNVLKNNFNIVFIKT